MSAILDFAEYFLFGAVIMSSACCPFLLVGLTSIRKQSSFESMKIGCKSAVISDSLFSLCVILKSCSPLKDGIFTTALSTIYFHLPSSSRGCSNVTSHAPLIFAFTVADVGNSVMFPFFSKSVFSGLYI